MRVKSGVSRRGRREMEGKQKEAVNLHKERTVISLIKHLVSAGRIR